jgi:hypothetical protein
MSLSNVVSNLTGMQANLITLQQFIYTEMLNDGTYEK